MESSIVRKYVGIGEEFMNFVGLLRNQPFVVPQPAVQAMYDCITRLTKLWVETGLPVRPKLHMLMHLVDRVPHQGNPAYYATWVDEGLNKLLASLGRQAHRSVWEARILTYFEHAQVQKYKRRRF